MRRKSSYGSFSLSISQLNAGDKTGYILLWYDLFHGKGPQFHGLVKS